MLGALTFVCSLRLGLFAYCCYREHESVLYVIYVLSLNRTSTVRLLLSRVVVYCVFLCALPPYSDCDCSPVAVCSPNFVRSLCLRMLACLLLWLRTRQAESVPDTLYSCCDVSALAVFSLRCVSFRLPSIIFVQFKKCKRII